MVGRTISHYRITEKIGEGGMGEVYKAEDTSLKRTVALKFLLPHALGGEEEKARFIREAQAAAALDHPNICTIYEIAEDQGRTFIAMAYLEGRDLGKKIADGPLKIGDALDIGQPQDLMIAPNLSPDGKRVAVWGIENGNSDIWIHDAARGLKTRLTFHPAREDRPIWSPSGDEIAFASLRDGTADVFTKAPDGSGELQPAVATLADEYVIDWSRDGKYLALVLIETTPDIWYAERKDDKTWGEPAPFVESPFDDREPVFSPDGRWLAYVTNESGRYEVYVQRFPEGCGRRQVSANGGIQPRWRRDGKELFYVEGETLVAVSVTTSPSFSVGRATKLFADKSFTRRRGHQYDVSADGQRFVVIETLDEPPPPRIQVAQNWFAEFRGRQGEAR